jgi:hypothetical protein
MIFPHWADRIQETSNRILEEARKELNKTSVSDVIKTNPKLAKKINKKIALIENGKLSIKQADDNTTKALDDFLKNYLINKFKSDSPQLFIDDKAPGEIYSETSYFELTAFADVTDHAIHLDSETSIEKAKSSQMHNVNNAVQSLLKQIKEQNFLHGFSLNEPIEIKLSIGSATLVASYESVIDESF